MAETGNDECCLLFQLFFSPFLSFLIHLFLHLCAHLEISPFFIFILYSVNVYFLSLIFLSYACYLIIPAFILSVSILRFYFYSLWTFSYSCFASSSFDLFIDLIFFILWIQFFFFLLFILLQRFYFPFSFPIHSP